MPVRMLGEESEDDVESLLPEVTRNVQQYLYDASEASDGPMSAPVERDDVLRALRSGNWDPLAENGSSPYFILDPIDGTKGFIRGEEHQYAIGLALIEGGHPTLGVVACPNLRFPSVRPTVPSG